MGTYFGSCGSFPMPFLSFLSPKSTRPSSVHSSSLHTISLFRPVSKPRRKQFHQFSGETEAQSLWELFFKFTESQTIWGLCLSWKVESLVKRKHCLSLFKCPDLAAQLELVGGLWLLLLSTAQTLFLSEHFPHSGFGDEKDHHLYGALRDDLFFF